MGVNSCPSTSTDKLSRYEAVRSQNLSDLDHNDLDDIIWITFKIDLESSYRNVGLPRPRMYVGLECRSVCNVVRPGFTQLLLYRFYKLYMYIAVFLCLSPCFVSLDSAACTRAPPFLSPFTTHTLLI